MTQDIIEILKISINKAIFENGVKDIKNISIEHPEDMLHGDYSCNVALVYAKELKTNPKKLAQDIVDVIKKDLPEQVLNVEIAGPGFINFRIKDSYFSNEIINIGNNIENFGKINIDSNKDVMVEYTDPNPFKIFHIGHLMANTIGESISRIIGLSGAKVIRACYQGDVGLHVAKTIWGILNSPDNAKEKIFSDSLSLIEKINCMGSCYVHGNEVYETNNNDEKSKIIEINKKIFEKSDKEINEIYNIGKKLSLEYFDIIYEKLGTKFDNFFFESEVADDGMRIVREFLKKGIFEESDGAIIFPGEKYGEHTRVFINSQGLPTYEAKEIGLNKRKFSIYPNLYESIIVTANEQDAYFRVVLKALKEIDENVGNKTKHISHGILRPVSGKMSSRKGNVIPAEVLIKDFEILVNEKMKDRNFTPSEKKIISNQVAIAGIKYTILKQSIGSDIVYDPNKSLSFEGDSGPYLQYATVRAKTVLNKASEYDLGHLVNPNHEVTKLEKLIIRFPEIVKKSRLEYAPHHIVKYLTELSSAFNSYYANYKIINNEVIENSPEIIMSRYRILLTKVFVKTMETGLGVLGIKVPERM